MAARISSRPDSIDTHIVDTAIDWAVKLDFNTPSAETRAAFEHWLLEKPSHAAAWQRVQSLKSDFAQLPHKLALDTLQATESRRRGTTLKRRQVMQLLCLAGISVSAGIAVQQKTPWQRLISDYSTSTGEQRTITLADGTTVMLNTDTAISTALSGDIREITVHRGEIAISTGKDSQFATRRPFWVATPHGRLRAIGTRFTTRLEKTRTMVSVTEGAVALHPRTSDMTVTIRAGQSWHFDDNTMTQIAEHAIEPGSWTDGVIACKHVRLGDLLTELSRYRHGRISVDEASAEIRVSGIYHVNDTDQVLRFLAQTQPITVSYLTRFWVNVRTKNTPDS